MSRLLSAMNIGLVTLVIFSGVDLFYSFVSVQLTQIPNRRRTVQKSEVTRQRAKRPLSHYQPILENNLFNVKIRPSQQEEVQPPKIDVESLKPTELELVLWGTITGSPGNSYAIIAEKGRVRGQGQQDLYRPGDTIKDAVIKRVLRGKVVLGVDGTDEVLTISERATRRTRAKPLARPVRQRRTLRRSTIEKTLQNLDQVAGQATINPHPEGLQLSGIRSRSIFRRMGLRNGDIITSVNDKTIRSVDDLLGIYRDVSQGSKFTLELKRGSRSRSIQYQIR